jgi:transcriptional regulator with XRE-family HTH domain
LFDFIPDFGRIGRIMDRQETPPAPDPALEKNLLRQMGYRIRVVRTMKGWTQKELSRRALMTPFRLSRLERGRSSPSLDELVRLRAALGAGIDQLVFGEPPIPGTAEAPPHPLLFLLEQDGAPAEVQMVLRLLRLLHLGYVTEKAHQELQSGPEPACSVHSHP